MMSPRIRRQALGAAIVFAVVTVLFLGLAVFIHSPPGERLAVRMVQGAVPGLHVEKLDIGWPFVLSANSVTLSDEKGPWLEISRPYLDWHPLRLLGRSLDIDRLSADSVIVERPPQPAQDQPAGQEEGTGGLPKFRLVLDRVAAPIILKPPVLGEEVRLDLSGTFQMEGGEGDVNLHLRAADGGFIRLAGRAGRDFLDLRWYVRVPRLQRWEGLAGVPMAGAVDGAGFVAGRLPRPAITGKLEMESGSVAGAAWDRLQTSFRAVPSAEGLHSSLLLNVTKPALDGEVLAPDAQLRSTFTIVPARQSVRFENTTLTAAGLNAGLRGVIGQWGKDADLSLSLTARDLAVSGPLAGLGWQGGVVLTATVSGDLLQQDVRAIIRGKATKLDTGNAALDRALGPSPRLRATVRIDPGLRLRVDKARLDAAAGVVEAAGEAWPRLDLSAVATIPKVGALADGVEGKVVGRVRLRGAVEQLAAWGSVELNDVIVAGQPPSRGTIGFDLADVAQSPNGRLTAQLDIAGHPVSAQAEVTASPVLRFSEILVESGQSRVTGNIALADDGPRGSLDGRIPNLAAWRDLAGADISGALDAQVTLTGETLAVTARGRNLQAAGMAFSALTATMQGTPRRFDFTAHGDGPLGAVALAGNAVVEGPRGLVELAEFRLRQRGQAVALTDGGRLLWGPDGVKLDPITVTAGGGRLRAVGSVVRGTLAGRLTLSEVPVSLAELAVPDLGAGGVVDGTVTLGGSLDQPTARLSLQGRRLAMSTTTEAGVQPLTARLDALWRQGRVQAELDAEDGGQLELSAQGNLPLTMGEDPFPDRAPISATMRVRGDLARLTEMLPLAGSAFAGRIDGNVTVSGVVARPELGGQVQLRGARYENLETGTIVEDLAADARIDGSRVEITAQGTDGRKGRAKLTGSAELGEGVDWQGNLAVTDFRALRGDDIRATVSAELTSQGQGGEGKIVGQATVEQAEVDIGRLQGGGPPTLEVVEVNRPGGPSDRSAGGGDGGDGAGPVTLGLDIAVVIDRAFIRGRGLDSEWGGRLQVAGTVADPSLTGAVEVRRGQYEFLGRTFRLTPESVVRFQGGQTIQPQLDVTGQARAGDVMAKVGITGTADNPRVNISSDPPLPQDEVLSRVLFGTEAGKLSAFQQIQLGQLAASGLGGGSPSFDPVGDLRGLLGLDVLEVGVGEGDQGGPNVAAGKYIGDETFLRVEQGTEGSPRVTVEQQLGGGFSVTSEVGEQSGGGVGIEWKKDY